MVRPAYRITDRHLVWTLGLGSGGGTYIQLFEDRVLLDPGEHDSHGVGPILQEGDLHPVHVIGQLLDVRLELCEGCRRRQDT